MKIHDFQEIQILEQQQMYGLAILSIGKLLEQLLYENLVKQNIQMKNTKNSLQELVAQTQKMFPHINPSFSIHCNTVQRFRNLSAHHNMV